MSKQKRWAKIRVGDTIDAGGREWLVAKLKPGKKRITVTIRSGKQEATQKISPDDRITLVRRGDEKRQPGRDAERAKRLNAAPFAKPRPGTEPPETPTGSPWETQQDRIEQKLDKILGARLIGETTDPDAGWFVPPVDQMTVAMHLLTFHAASPAELDDVTDMLALHKREHERVRAGKATLAVNHWHTEKRPEAAK